jgi:hypothetical protein
MGPEVDYTQVSFSLLPLGQDENAIQKGPLHAQEDNEAASASSSILATSNIVSWDGRIFI